MARILPFTINWTKSPASDIAAYTVYAGKAALGAAWIPDVDAGKIPPTGTVPGTDTSYTFAPGSLNEDTWQFAVCAKDKSGNYSDPHQAPAWVAVPLDQTAPPPPTNGSIA